jgi:hypothetical protein
MVAPYSTQQVRINFRKSAMRKVMTIVALALTLVSATTFAASAAAVFEDATHGAGAASQR